MVRSLSRGQFHVMSSWDEPAIAVEAPITEAPNGGLGTVEAPVEELPVFEPSFDELLVAEEEKEEAQEEETAGTEPPPKTQAPPVAVASAEPSPATAPPKEERTTAARPAVSPADAERTLVGLLARMWLMRSSVATAGGIALSAPAPPTIPSAPSETGTPPAPPTIPPAPSETVTPPAPPTIPPAPSVTGAPQAAPTVPPPAPPVLPPYPPAPPAAPVPQTLPPPLPTTPRETTSREETDLHLPDMDDRRPLSGLASFLVEVADASHPPAPQRPSIGRIPRARIVFQIVHCPHPIPERPVSRSPCHQRRVGE